MSGTSNQDLVDDLVDEIAQMAKVSSFSPELTLRQRELLAESLRPTDRVLSVLKAATGRILNQRDCCLVLLEDRILNAHHLSGFGGTSVDVFPLKSIVDVQFSRGLAFGTLTISTPGGGAELGYIGPEGNGFVRDVIAAKDALNSRSEAKRSGSGGDRVSKIQELVVLLEAGHITPEEFENLKVGVLQDREVGESEGESEGESSAGGEIRKLVEEIEKNDKALLVEGEGQEYLLIFAIFFGLIVFIIGVGVLFS